MIVPAEGDYVIDTNDLIRALQGSENRDKMKLEHLCQILGIETEFLHNAGNDAHVRNLQPSGRNIKSEALPVYHDGLSSHVGGRINHNSAR